MDNFILQDMNIPLIVGFTVIVILLGVALNDRKRNKKQILDRLDKCSTDIQENTRFSMDTSLIELSPNSDIFIKFAIETWRIKQKFNKIRKKLSDNEYKGIENSLQKIEQYFNKSDIEIVDYTDQKFNEGLNLEVLSVEEDSNIIESRVKETIEPTIMYKGKVIKRAKIIVINKV